MLSESQTKFFQLAKQYESLKDQLALAKEELDKTMTELGLNTYHQDPETGLVYKVQKSLGKYVVFSEVEYTRTKKSDETRGSLSKSEVEKMGFKL